MPNHFHFFINTDENLIDNALNKKIGTMLSSYTRAINIQEGRTGSLFREHSKAKPLDIGSPTGSGTPISGTPMSGTTTDEYPFICFNYIHQNPMKAGLVKKMEDWEFSSFKVNHQQKYWNITKNNFSFVAHIHYIRNHQILGMLNAILKFGSGCFL